MAEQKCPWYPRCTQRKSANQHIGPTFWGVGETVANLQVFLWGLGLLLVLVNLEGPKIQSTVMDINIYGLLKNLIDKRTLKKTHHFSSLVQLKTGQQSLSERMF